MGSGFGENFADATSNTRLILRLCGASFGIVVVSVAANLGISCVGTGMYWVAVPQKEAR